MSRPSIDTRPLLEVEALTISYGDVPAVREASMIVAEGEVVALIGANGAGKTTTLSAISGVLGLKGGRIVGGRVRFAGRDITGRPPHLLVADGIVHVPEGREILGRLTVAENLDLGAYPLRDRSGLAREIDSSRGRGHGRRTGEGPSFSAPVSTDRAGTGRYDR